MLQNYCSGAPCFMKVTVWRWNHCQTYIKILTLSFQPYLLPVVGRLPLSITVSSLAHLISSRWTPLSFRGKLKAVCSCEAPYTNVEKVASMTEIVEPFPLLLRPWYTKIVHKYLQIGVECISRSKYSVFNKIFKCIFEILGKPLCTETMAFIYPCFILSIRYHIDIRPCTCVAYLNPYSTGWPWSDLYIYLVPVTSLNCPWLIVRFAWCYACVVNRLKLI